MTGAPGVGRLVTRLLPAALAAALLACSAGTAGGPTVVAGQARFQFLTASLVRMEYSPTGHFVDAPSAVVQKRDWTPLTVRTRRQNGWLVASTGALTLRYRLNSGPLAAGNFVGVPGPQRKTGPAILQADAGSRDHDARAEAHVIRLDQRHHHAVLVGGAQVDGAAFGRLAGAEVLRVRRVDFPRARGEVSTIEQG